MRTALDSNVISAILSGEPTASELVRQLGTARREGAVLLCPAVFAELHAYPGATPEFLDEFLRRTGVTVDFTLGPCVWGESGLRFCRYAERRRRSGGQEPRRLLADFLIGAHALLQADRLMTLDPKIYAQDFPELKMI